LNIDIANYKLHHINSKKKQYMSVIKVIEILANSNKSWEDAAQQGINEAAKTLNNIRSIYIKEHSAIVNESNKIVEYRITAKLSFEIETPELNAKKS
jgi:flavin-binding protein dodecin